MSTLAASWNEVVWDMTYANLLMALIAKQANYHYSMEEKEEDNDNNEELGTKDFKELMGY